VAGWALVYLPFAEALSTHAVYGFDFLEEEDRITRYADAVEATDPKGPYVLAGYSAGGNVAFEVARELVRRGREVSDVLLFDSRRREEPVTESPEAVRARVLREFEEGLARLGEQTREAMRSEQLREVALRKRERYVRYWNALVNDGTVPARLHVLGEEAEPGSPDALAPERWRTATTGPFTVHAGAGRHAEMMEAPFAGRNAELVRRLLSGE
jgi:thioesterase domain-containing protein